MNKCVHYDYNLNCCLLWSTLTGEDKLILPCIEAPCDDYKERSKTDE